MERDVGTSYPFSADVEHGFKPLQSPAPAVLPKLAASPRRHRKWLLKLLPFLVPLYEVVVHGAHFLTHSVFRHFESCKFYFEKKYVDILSKNQGSS